MEDRCEFIWQIIEESPFLHKRLNELEQRASENSDEQVNVLIDFFREMEEILECVTDAYNQTKILNYNSYLIRMRS